MDLVDVDHRNVDEDIGLVGVADRARVKERVVLILALRNRVLVGLVWQRASSALAVAASGFAAPTRAAAAAGSLARLLRRAALAVRASRSRAARVLAGRAPFGRCCAISTSIRLTSVSQPLDARFQLEQTPLFTVPGSGPVAWPALPPRPFAQPAQANDPRLREVLRAACGCSRAFVVGRETLKRCGAPNVRSLDPAARAAAPDECPLPTGVVREGVTALPVDDAGPGTAGPRLTLLGVSAGTPEARTVRASVLREDSKWSLRGRWRPAALGQNRRAHSAGDRPNPIDPAWPPRS